jgi:hypothetical protein
MASIPDRTWANLVAGLGDNNDGAITEEDVRAITAYARHSSFEQAFEGQTSALDSASWGKLPDPDDNVPYLRIQSQRATAVKAYQHYTGHLAEVANLGPRYIEGDPEEDGPVQPRQFTVDWSISIETPNDIKWGVSLWRLAKDATWPGTGDVWPTTGVNAASLPVAFSSSLLKVENGVNIWGATGSGSTTLTLNPGDTIVPVLEYLGSFESTGSAPRGTIKAFTTKVTSSSPVQGNWQTTPSLGTVANLWDVTKGSSARAIAAAETDLIPTGGSRQTVRVVPPTEPLPTSGNYNGRLLWEETTGHIKAWKDGNWLTYVPSTVKTGVLTVTHISGPVWSWTGSGEFAKFEQTGQLVQVRMRGLYSAAGSGGFSRIDIRGMPAPFDADLRAALFGQLEDASAGGAGRYPISGLVNHTPGVSPYMSLRPSSVDSELTATSPIPLASNDAIVLQFSYITSERP